MMKREFPMYDSSCEKILAAPHVLTTFLLKRVMATHAPRKKNVITEKCHLTRIIMLFLLSCVRKITDNL